MNLKIKIKIPLSFDKNCPSKSSKDLTLIKFYQTPIIIISEQRKGKLLLMTELLIN